MIVAVAGRIGSGKTAVAGRLAELLGAKLVGFGDFVRAKAEEEQLDYWDRSVLQEFGQKLVSKNPSAFLDQVLYWGGYVAGQNLVLDGLRHLSVWKALEARCAQTLEPILVYLDVDEHMRRSRLVGRSTSDELSEADLHAMELESVGLRASAQLVLRAEDSPDDLANSIIAWIGTG